MNASIVTRKGKRIHVGTRYETVRWIVLVDEQEAGWCNVRAGGSKGHYGAWECGFTGALQTGWAVTKRECVDEIVEQWEARQARRTADR